MCSVDVSITIADLNLRDKMVKWDKRWIVKNRYYFLTSDFN